MDKQDKTSKSLTVSAKQLANDMLGVSVRQVWRLDSTGKLPRKVRIGGCCRWVRSEIISWVEHGCPDRAGWELIKDQL